MRNAGSGACCGKTDRIGGQQYIGKSYRKQTDGQEFRKQNSVFRSDDKQNACCRRICRTVAGRGICHDQQRKTFWRKQMEQNIRTKNYILLMSFAKRVK